MTDYHAIPELLEEYMQAHGDAELWVTVPEFRTHFEMDVHSSPAISGFFRKLSQGPFFTCPYRVARIEKLIVTAAQRRTIKRYLIIRRPEPKEKQARGPVIPGYSYSSKNINSPDERMISHRRRLHDGQRRVRNSPLPTAGKAPRPAHH